MTYTVTGTGGCSNATATRTVTVTAATSAGTLSGTQGICVAGSSTFSSTVAGGSWSSGNTGIATINASTGAISAVAAGTTTMTYTIAGTGTGGCSDATANRTLTISAIPTITGTTSNSRCGTGTVAVGATSTGNINWYAAASGGASLGTGTSFTTPSIAATTTYYVDASFNGCPATSRTAVTATVNDIPTITGTTPDSRCGTGTVALGATASAGTINWYAASTGGVSLGTGTSFTTPSISSTTTYYVDATSNGCTTAARTAVTATVSTLIPSAPTSSAASSVSCTSMSANWSAATDARGYYLDVNTASDFTGTAILSSQSTGNVTTYSVTGLTASTTYYYRVRAFNACGTSASSSTITQATTATTPAQPGSITGTAAQCPSLTSQTYSISAVSNATSYTWTVPTGWTITAGGTTNSVTLTTGTAGQNGNITVTASNTCGTSTANTLAVTVTTNGSFVTGTIGTAQTICYNATPNSLTNSASPTGGTGSYTYQWQSSTDNSNWSNVSSATSATYAPGALTSNTYYRRAETSGGCGTVNTSGILITVYANLTITASSAGARGTTGKAAIQATSNIGSISWYAASSGGSSLGTSNSGVNWTTPAIASTTAYYAEAVIGSCVSASRTSVSATVSDNLTIIGKSTASSFSQKQSNTTTDSLRVFVSTYAASNDANVGTITNDESFIAISHDGGLLKATTASNTEKPVGIVSRLAREWLVTNTNFSDNFSLEMEWNVTGNVDLADIRLLVDDDGDFSNATVYAAGGGLTFELGSIIVRGIGTSKIPSGSSKYVTIGSVSASTPLPVDFSLFNAEFVHDHVKINWQTTTETNNNYFIIQKSTNGRTWENIDRVEGAKNSSQNITYHFDDKTPYLGTSYYRLKQVDLDGKYTYSETKMVNVDAIDHDEIHVNPNPTTGVFTIKGDQINIEDIAIFDVNGKNVTALVKMQNAQTEIHVDLENLNDGVYILKVKDTFFVKIDKI